MAVRVSAHSAVKSLCDKTGFALVSTSANISGQDSCDDCDELFGLWGDQVDYYLNLPLGGASKPSTIRLANSGDVIR